MRNYVVAFGVLIGLQGFATGGSAGAARPASTSAAGGPLHVASPDPWTKHGGMLSRFSRTGQAVAARPRVVTSRFEVTVPSATEFIDESETEMNHAELFIENGFVEGTGDVRIVESRPLEAGKSYTYTFTARWRSVGYIEMVRSKTVEFTAGETVRVDLTRDEGNDRANVAYISTPQDIALEMVALAQITPDDVVYEPGCGDARITIAAVKAGARKGVGIDIDPDRVVEARANVKAAGLEDRIEIRQGDALDIKDLADATVVFLFMGNDFNMLLRPILWRQLRVGARVVSHRFTMGDWPPDKTASMSGKGWSYGGFDVHLWSITQAVKDRVR